MYVVNDDNRHRTLVILLFILSVERSILPLEHSNSTYPFRRLAISFKHRERFEFSIVGICL